jgi:hypothetical protein
MPTELCWWIDFIVFVLCPFFDTWQNTLSFHTSNWDLVILRNNTESWSSGTRRVFIIVCMLLEDVSWTVGIIKRSIYTDHGTYWRDRWIFKKATAPTNIQAILVEKRRYVLISKSECNKPTPAGRVRLSSSLASHWSDSPHLDSHWSDSPELAIHWSDSLQLASHWSDSPQLAIHWSDSPQLAIHWSDSPQ